MTDPPPRGTLAPADAFDLAWRRGQARGRGLLPDRAKALLYRGPSFIMTLSPRPAGQEAAGGGAIRVTGRLPRKDGYAWPPFPSPPPAPPARRPRRTCAPTASSTPAPSTGTCPRPASPSTPSSAGRPPSPTPAPSSPTPASAPAALRRTASWSPSRPRNP